MKLKYYFKNVNKIKLKYYFSFAAISRIFILTLKISIFNLNMYNYFMYNYFTRCIIILHVTH